MTVSSSRCAVPTSHVTVLLSHLVVPFFFFFSHLMVPLSHSTVLISHLTKLLSHLVVPLFIYFFLTFDGSIVTLDSTNITSDCIFITFSGTLFLLTFDDLLLHWIVPTSLVTVLLSQTIVPFYFLHLTVPLSYWTIPISHLTIILLLGPPLKSLFYLLITVYHNSN